MSSAAGGPNIWACTAITAVYLEEREGVALRVSVCRGHVIHELTCVFSNEFNEPPDNSHTTRFSDMHGAQRSVRRAMGRANMQWET